MDATVPTGDTGVTLLKEKQIWGDKALQVMKSYGTTVGMSDLAVLIGGALARVITTTSDGQRSSFVWSASSNADGNVRAVYSYGGRSWDDQRERYGGARPALPSSVASSIGLSEAEPSKKISGVDVVEYGEYPQTIADENITRELEQAFSKNQLQKTGKTYNFDSEKRNSYNPFKPKEHAEYQHKGKKYICVEAKPYDYNNDYDNDQPALSNGKKPQTGEVYWIEVQPIEWLRDPGGICVARQALFAGVQFDRNRSYDGKFEKTDMYRYLQEYFFKEMQPSRAVEAPAAEMTGTVADYYLNEEPMRTVAGTKGATAHVVPLAHGSNHPGIDRSGRNG
jgi:hypothetical protein